MALRTGEYAALLPVVGMMLQFSPTEVRRCQEALARERPEPLVDAATMGSVDGSAAADYGMLSGWLPSWAFGAVEEPQPKLPG